jgi:CIC family chloride channel protein
MVAVMSPVIGAPMTALLFVFEFTRSYEITIAAMLAIVFANLIAFRWNGRSLYDRQLSARGIDLSKQMAAKSTSTAVIVDDDNRYLGQVFQHQLRGQVDNAKVDSIELRQGSEFHEATSIWEAMEFMRSYIGEAIAVVDRDSGLYLGAVPEAIVINAYLDAAQELRREEYEV